MFVKKKTNKKKSLLLLLIGILLLSNIIMLFLFTNHSVTKKNVTIVLTENGFSPPKITITKGTTVTFTTDRGVDFWPASNLHPTHDIYPAFDPQEPIKSDSQWSFTFNEEGSWNYHDHLAPLFRGIIIVTGQDINMQTRRNLERNPCEGIKSVSAKGQCTDTLFSDVLEKKGIDAGFDLMEKIFIEDPTFSSSCHDFAHRLGEKTYDLFTTDRKVVLSEKSSYCGYGFYHGFMEKLLYASNDISEAQAFCDYAEQTLAEKTADAGGACYHGIGHGVVEDTPDPNAWGDAQAIIRPGLELCKKVSPSKEKLYRCDTGVFNALEILMTNSKYDLSLNRSDPYWICRAQENRHKEACYTQMVVAVMNSTNHNFAESAAIIDQIKEDSYAIPAMYTLTIELVHTMKEDHARALHFCRSLPERFKTTCITSYAEGFMKYGPPKKEYVGAVAFCNSPLLHETEKNACFKRILSILRIWYTVEKATEICRSIEENYQYNRCDYT